MMLKWLKQLLGPARPEDDRKTSVTSFFFTIRYAFLGVIFGCLFPLLAMVILIGDREAVPLGLSSLVEFHYSEPLLWLIYAVPLFLGLLAAMAGYHEDKLRQTYAHLQQDIKEISRLRQLAQQLERRTTQLSISAEISHSLSTILDLEGLLSEVVQQIKGSFGYYHAHIYLLDGRHSKLVVAAGTGLAGEEMKAKGHNIPLDAASLVARAARTGDIVTVDNVREAEDWLPNPLLPDTCSEMAVPVILEGVVVGVLDVQEDKIAGLDEGDASLLRSLANQVAVAIRNARLFDEVQTALAEARELQQQYIEETWDHRRLVRQGIGRVQFSLGESSSLDEATIIKARRLAFLQAEPTPVTIADQVDTSAAKDASGGDQQTDDPSKALERSGQNGLTTSEPKQALVAPITLHGIPIGNLQLHQGSTRRVWTRSELALINAVIDQVAQTAENLRLLDRIQERASREQLISQISAKLRRAPDMETLLEIGTTELARALNPARTFVKLGSKAEFSAKSREEGLNDNSIAKTEDASSR